jgi:Ca-activated chloride channel family protein
MTLTPSRLGVVLALLLAGSTQACSLTASELSDTEVDGTTSSGGTTNQATGTGGGGAVPGGGGEPADGSRAGGHDRADRPEAPFADTKADLPECQSGKPTVPFYLSSDDSNSMASPVIAREHLEAGLEPNPAQIRTYEFLNYYNVHYDLPAPQGDTLGIFAELEDLGPSLRTGLPSYRLQIGVQAFDVPRPELVITFVVDSSGSLVGPGFERERAAILAIAHQLEAGDIVNIVKWANEGNVLLEKYVASGTQADDDALAAAVKKLAPTGGSDLHGGLVKGYELAMAHFDAAKLNRVVLISDGGANIGVLDRQIISAAAQEANDEGIYLVGIGVGPALGYSDNLMDLVTDSGRGAYVYLDSVAEADAVFKERFDEIMNVAARAVQVRVDLPEYIEIEKFYGEEYASSPENIEPQNLAPGDSMIFNQVIYLKTPSEACGFDTVKATVTWQTPITHELRHEETQPASLLELLSVPPSARMRKANAIIAYAEALKSGDPAELGAALTLVEDTQAATGDADLGKIAALLLNHPKLEQ